MTYLVAEHDAPETFDDNKGAAYDEDVTARISNPEKENGEPTAGPLSWLNSARVMADIDEDAVHCVVSIDDPRGGLCFTIRRIPGGENKGRIIVHVPTPGQGMAHLNLRELHPGTFVVVDEKGEPRTFEDDEIEAEYED